MFNLRGTQTADTLGGIGMASKVYMMENLGCAHCASQIEQKVRQLRGSAMQDVIFAGTELRKAQGFAAVSITLDNST